MQTFDQSLFRLLQDGRISLEEAIHNATNSDEFKMRVAGILSAEQAIGDVQKVEQVAAPASDTQTQPLIVKH